MTNTQKPAATRPVLDVGRIRPSHNMRTKPTPEEMSEAAMLIECVEAYVRDGARGDFPLALHPTLAAIMAANAALARIGWRIERVPVAAIKTSISPTVMSYELRSVEPSRTIDVSRVPLEWGGDRSFSEPDAATVQEIVDRVAAAVHNEQRELCLTDIDVGWRDFEAANAALALTSWTIQREHENDADDNSAWVYRIERDWRR